LQAGRGKQGEGQGWRRRCRAGRQSRAAAVQESGMRVVSKDLWGRHGQETEGVKSETFAARGQPLGGHFSKPGGGGEVSAINTRPPPGAPPSRLSQASGRRPPPHPPLQRCARARAPHDTPRLAGTRETRTATTAFRPHNAAPLHRGLRAVRRQVLQALPDHPPEAVCHQARAVHLLLCVRGGPGGARACPSPNAFRPRAPPTAHRPPPPPHPPSPPPRAPLQAPAATRSSPMTSTLRTCKSAAP
jgi:hypothetical protein